MDYPFIVYLKNRTSSKFEYKSDVTKVVSADTSYRITFGNGRTYNYGADRVQYYPLVSRREHVRIYEGGKLNERYNTVDNYGRYLIFRDKNSGSSPVENNANIEICSIKKNTRQAKSLINYFKEILHDSVGVSFDIQSGETPGENPNQIGAEILLKALDDIDISESRSALSNYIDGINPATRAPKKALIYPFGCNESQKLAVGTSLSNSISIIEGPPGTGKTQTILNIVANLIVEKKTVAIVSNNNAAVSNVRKKLAEYGYGMVAAALGNNDNKALFFNNLEEQTVNPDFKVSGDRLIKAKNEVRDLDTILATSFQYRNKLAVLKTELSDAEIEFSHLKVEQPIKQDIQSVLNKKLYRKWNFRTTLKLKNLLSPIDLKNKMSILNKLRLMLQYGLFDMSIIRRYSEEFSVYVNHKFYELYIAKIKSEILDVENWLVSNKEEANLRRFIEASGEVFNGVLYEKYNNLNKMSFNRKDYLKQFPDFIEHYPVILSSTLSLHTSIPKGYLFDYLIIDESSQVDIIKSAVCFSCSRNVIVVGDSMQLAHIIDKRSKDAAEQLHTKYDISYAYDYVKHNILDSLKNLYRDEVKSVLLKEHYRCHPTIIGFCNKKYYLNKLVIMTSSDSHPFRIIETNIAGGKGNYNQRQIHETDFYIRNNYAADYTRVGVIAPYRQHADMLTKQIPDGVEADTIHKFQGREKDVIIFNTVKDKIGAFIDNPYLINVAVSRAVKEFIIIKPKSMDLPHGTHVGDLIRYICYTTDPDVTIVKGSISSVFDLLYKEYNKVFTSFLSSNKKLRGSAAEIVVHKLLSENVLINNIQFSSIDMVREYRLSDLIRHFKPFSEDEIKFIKNNSRLDFLLYNRIDKSPVLAIEVDGVAFHDNELQRVRDSKKNRILNVIGLPLVRLSTDGHDEEARIIESLSAAMGIG